MLINHLFIYLFIYLSIFIYFCTGAIIRDGDRNEMSFSLLGLSPCVVPKNLFLEKIAPSRVPHARKFCEVAAQVTILKMASEMRIISNFCHQFPFQV